MKKLFKYFLLTTSLFLSACTTNGYSGSESTNEDNSTSGNNPPNNNETIQVESILFDKTEIVLQKNETSSIVSVVLPENATNKLLYWESDNPDVASVNNNGQVTGLNEGGALITATSSNGITASCAVSVEDSLSFNFPNLDTFETEMCYQSPDTTKYMYQAKATGHEVDIYMKQMGTIDIGDDNNLDLTKSHVEVVVFDSSFGNGNNGTNFRLFGNGQYYVSNSNGLHNVKVRTTLIDQNTLEYRLMIFTKNPVSENTFVKFYSHDVASDTPYNNDDYVCQFNNTSYHTILPEKLSVKDKICFYNKSNYVTPLQFASVVPNKYGYQMSAQKEGLYIYAYQRAENKYDVFDQQTKWINASHIEIELFQHNVGYGFGGSYLAFWQDGSYYSNILDVPSNPQLKDLVCKVDITGTENNWLIEYYIFLKFNNNLENPNDGPYSYIKPRFFDVDEGANRYNNYDVVEYRDDRFLHTIPGNSLIVHNSIDGLDNPFETSYAANKLKMFNDNNKTRDNLTLFIGDSYFEPEGWWTRFYNDSLDGFYGKNAASSAIGGTKVSQWLNWDNSLIRPYADNNGRIKNIVIHLGYNDIGLTNATDLQILDLMYELLNMLHTKYPDTSIYFVGIGRSEWFENTYRNINGVNILRADTASNVDGGVYNYSLSRNWLTFVDTNNIYTRIKNQEGVDLAGIFKDGTHPKNEYYRYFIEAIVNAGCQINNI